MHLFDQFDHCLVCQSTHLISFKGYEQQYLVKCSSCNFVFCKRRPSLDELKAHYSLYPRANSISKITMKRYDDLLDKFEPYRKTNNIIDVGCGDGFFLEVAKKRKWNVFGTEFTQNAIEVCQQKGIKMTISPLGPTCYERDFFDIITSFEVIEHISNPVQELNSYSSILRKGGIVYVTTPNFDSVSRTILKSKWNVIEYPEHLSYYNRQTLTSLFKMNNYRRIEITTTGISFNRLRASVAKVDFANVPINMDESLRQKAEAKFILKMFKVGANTLLSISNKGDSMKALFQKQ